MIKIGKRLTLSYKNPPLIIAEISGNHCGNKNKFLELIKSAFKNGADLVKIQTYEPEDITLNKKSNKFKIRKGIWKNQYLWNLYKKACTPFAWHEDAFKIAKKNKKILFSSPFSLRAVDLLEKFKVKLYKIASFEITDLKLIDYVASKKKPIIISTGMSSIKEVKRAIKIINKHHNKIIIMHCVSNYPTKLKDTNLYRINYLKKVFKKNLIGISDHTNDIQSSISSISIGVVAIEKHFKLNDSKTPDSEFSIEKNKLKKLKNDSLDLFKSINKKKIKTEKININLRRSIFAKKNIDKKEKINSDNIVSLRPNIGIPSEYFFKILGKKVKKKIKKNDPIFFKNIYK